MKRRSWREMPKAIPRVFAPAVISHLAYSLAVLTAWLTDPADRHHILALFGAANFFCTIGLSLLMVLAATAPGATTPAGSFAHALARHLANPRQRQMVKLLAWGILAIASLLFFAPAFMDSRPSLALISFTMTAVTILPLAGGRSYAARQADTVMLQALDINDPCLRVGPYLTAIRPRSVAAWAGIATAPILLVLALSIEWASGPPEPGYPDYTCYSVLFIVLAGSLSTATFATLVLPGKIWNFLLGAAAIQFFLSSLFFGWIIGYVNNFTWSITTSVFQLFCYSAYIFVNIYLAEKDWPNRERVFVRRHPMISNWNASPVASGSRPPTS